MYYYNTIELFSWIIWQKKIAVSQHIKKNVKLNNIKK